MPWFKLPSAPVLFAIVPPEPVVPLPVTVKPPRVPVLSRIMPLAVPLPFDVMLRNSNLFELIVVFVTFNAVPVVVVNVFTNAPVAFGLHGFSSQTLIVPPPVAAIAGFAPELTVTSEKVNVAPVLLPVKFAPVPPAVVSLVMLKLLPVPTFDNKKAVPVVVVIFTSLTLTPVIAAAGSFIPVLDPVLMFIPLTLTSVLRVTVP